jgi:hypothetical protein
MTMKKPSDDEPQVTVAFVDAVEDQVARLLIGDRAVDFPRALLPVGAREGSWVKIGVAVIPPPPDNTQARRQRMGEGDPGGDISL